METESNIPKDRSRRSAPPRLAAKIRPRTWGTPLLWSGVVASVLTLSLAALGQDRPPTIRRHEVEVDNPMYPPELAQAEAAMDKKDYATAEPLLKEVVAHNAANDRAWFDLGFVENAVRKPDDAI